METVLATLERELPEVCVIDSVQTLRTRELSGAPGSVGQVREVAGEIMRVAKARALEETERVLAETQSELSKISSDLNDSTLSGDSQRILSGSSDGAVKVWNLDLDQRQLPAKGAAGK